MPGSAAAQEVSFRRRDLGSGITLHEAPGDRWKTATVRVYLHGPLRADTVTANALLASVLGRGCRGYPTLQALARRLQELFGASLGTGVVKNGDVQSVFASIEAVDDRFLAPGAKALAGAVDLLRRTLLEPQGFRADVVAQEGENLARRIRSTYNDKIRYAAMRCVEEMCRGEAFALHAFGREEDIHGLTPPAVEERYRGLLATAPVDIFVVGGSPEMGVALGEALAAPGRRPEAVRSVNPGPGPEAPRTVQEAQPVNQGKLCLGYRTDVTLPDPRFATMVVYNGILGGFVHSKLFRNVREKASLAYYASSRYEASKGILLISSGIDVDRYQQALEIIQAQVAEMAAGHITDEEMDFTRRGLENRMRSAEDSPGAKIELSVEESLAGGPVPLSERLAQIARVSRQDVVEVARGVRLDTIYFLTAEGPAGREAAPGA